MSYENKVKRRYDIGNGVTIVADEYTIRAEWKPDTNSSTSIGIRRPPPKVTDSVKAIYSLDGKFFYLPTYCHVGIDGFWLSIATWDSKEEMNAQQSKSICGDKPGATFTPSAGPMSGKTYHREILHFHSWSVKSDNVEHIPKMDDDVEGELAKDYLSLCMNIDNEHMTKFNADIAFSGWTLKDILEATGPWVPVAEIPVIKIEKRV